ncbi:MAG: IclR family transcriptional regulator [Eubacteriales bacterium]|nr:IclR family transcriptional regulator [Eubacteriales bacterium]
MAVKSAERVLEIFDLLEMHPNGMTNKEISETLNYAQSSTLGILKTMKERGYLLEDEQKRYYLGGRLMAIGATIASRIDVGKVAAPYLHHLMLTLEETCFLGVLSGKDIIYIAKETCARAISTNASIGSKKPVYCTGLGKAFLAFMPSEKSTELAKRLTFVPYTAKTVKNLDELREQIFRFREWGYAIDDQEIEDGLWCLAVPIYDGSGTMVAAISTSGLKMRMIEKFDVIKKEMLDAAEGLSKALGYIKEEI